MLIIVYNVQTNCKEFDEIISLYNDQTTHPNQFLKNFTKNKTFLAQV